MYRIVDWTVIDAALEAVPIPVPRGALKAIAEAHGILPKTLSRHIQTACPRLYHAPHQGPALRDPDDCPGCPECAGFVPGLARVTVLPVPPVCWCRGCGRRKVAATGPWADLCAICRAQEAA